MMRPGSLRDRLDEHDIAKLITAYRDGTTAVSLAATHSVSLRSIKRLLQAAGIRRTPLTRRSAKATSAATDPGGWCGAASGWRCRGRRPRGVGGRGGAQMVVTAGRSARSDLDRRDTLGDADPHHRDVGKGITPMTISFLLTPEQEQLKAAARGFAQDQLRDLAAVTRAEPDPKTRALLLRPAFENAVAAGFLKGLIPAPFCGAASSGVDAAIFIEEWAAESPDFVISMAGPLIALAPVYQVGTPEQVERFVRPTRTQGLPHHSSPTHRRARSARQPPR